ncbi:erythromycin esterase family protein [Pseudonocardia sp. MCCB 268]|nr:erythromycin esterase family protein [Pseudonocardia cytotoxica]
MRSVIPCETVLRLPADDPARLAESSATRVVAIGENNHGVRGFGALRVQLVRFLVRELGFGVVAWSQDSPSVLVDTWIRAGVGTSTTRRRTGYVPASDADEMHAMRGLREHHEAGGRVPFTRLDIPGSGGAPEPALRVVREHLAAWAPRRGGFRRRRQDAAAHRPRPTTAQLRSIIGNSTPRPATAPPRPFARLLLRLEGARARPEHRVVRHHARGALRLDEQLREFAVLFAPSPPLSRLVTRRVHGESIRRPRAAR